VTGFSAPGAPLAALALLALGALFAYHNSFDGRFLFDDRSAILENPDLRHLATTLRENPGAGPTLVGRPVLRLSLWINYALGGLAVRGYHVLNLLLHVLAAWTLWALARRLLESPGLRGRYRETAFGLALAIALIWTVHPLQTESVSYVVQRAEILGGLFYLLTLYSVTRCASAGGRGSGVWGLLAVASCLAGVASKETVATAPLLALAMDRVFFEPSWRRLWQARRGLYLALCSTWIVLALLMRISSRRLGSAGFGLGMHWWEYALTQPYFICRYLGLSLFPSTLTLDYGFYLARTFGEVAPYAALVLLLLTLTVVGLWLAPPLGFCGLWFFLILAPTSSVVPLVTQTGAEHRMYLPLAGLIALGVVAGEALWLRAPPGLRTRFWGVPWLVLVSLVAALGVRTVQRNEDYRSELSIWQSVANDWPSNPRAHYNLGIALANAGRPREAILQYEEAVRLPPDAPDPHFNLASLLASAGRASEAIHQYEEGLRLEPDSAEAHFNLGNLLAGTARVPQAIAHYEEGLRLEPDSAEAHFNLGNLLVIAGRRDEAIVQYKEALRLKPDLDRASINLGSVLANPPSGPH